MANSNNLRSDPTKIRRSFRVPVKIQDGISVVLDNKPYHVVNLSPEGVNIANTDHAPFTIGELIENCNFVVSGSSIKGLTARVVHCSCGSDGKWNNGIQWINLKDKELAQIADVVADIKQKLRQQISRD